MAIGLIEMLRRQWRIAALTAAVGMMIVLLAVALMPKTYRANASAVIVPGAAITQPTDVLRSLDTLERRTVIATLARIPSASETRTALAAHVRLDRRELERYRITAVVVPQTNIVRIDVEGPDPVMAANLANASMDLTADAAARLYRIYAVRMLERADATVRSAGPGLSRGLLVAIAIGLLLGVAAALAVERAGYEWRRRLRSRLPLGHAS